MAETKKLVCFLDLLGTKENSRISENEYYSAIESMHTSLGVAKKILTDGYMINCFSDCAFMSLNIDDCSFKFFSLLRQALFSKGYFFKCSIIGGELDVSHINNDSNNFSSTIFGTKSVEAYLLHENFKGLGYIIHKDLYNIECVRERTVKSVFIYGINSKLTFIPYIDIAYEDNYIGNDRFYHELTSGKLVKGEDNDSSKLNFEIFVKRLIISKNKNIKYSKYYISSIISLINSSDFSTISYSHDRGWSEVPLMFYKIFIDINFYKNLSNVNGSEIMHYVALNKLYHDSEHSDDNTGEFDRVKDQLAIITSKRKKIKNFISKTPAFIFKANYLNDFLERVANYDLGLIEKSS